MTKQSPQRNSQELSPQKINQELSNLRFNQTFWTTNLKSTKKEFSNTSRTWSTPTCSKAIEPCRPFQLQPKSQDLDRCPNPTKKNKSTWITGSEEILFHSSSLRMMSKNFWNCRLKIPDLPKTLKDHNCFHSKISTPSFRTLRNNENNNCNLYQEKKIASKVPTHSKICMMPTWIKIKMKIRPTSLQEKTVTTSLTMRFLGLSRNKDSKFSIKAKWS